MKVISISRKASLNAGPFDRSWCKLADGLNQVFGKEVPVGKGLNHKERTVVRSMIAHGKSDKIVSDMISQSVHESITIPFNTQKNEGLIRELYLQGYKECAHELRFQLSLMTGNPE